MNDHILSAKREQFLRDIGLSRDAIALYRLLLARKTLTAQEAGIELHAFASATYRLFYKLEQWGLAERLEGRPMAFAVAAKVEGMERARHAYDDHLARLLRTRGVSRGEQIEVVEGPKALHERYVSLVNEAKQNIATFSMGVRVSRQLYDALSAAVKRGVTVHRVAQLIRTADRDAATKLVRLGIELRQNPTAMSLHATVFDGARVLISFIDPHDNERGVSVVTTNRALILLFESQFNELWARGRATKR